MKRYLSAMLALSMILALAMIFTLSRILTLPTIHDTPIAVELKAKADELKSKAVELKVKPEAIPDSEPVPATKPDSKPKPEPEPEPKPDPSSDAAEVTPAAIVAEGVVKEASPTKIIITLADGTELALDTSGITGLDVHSGDTVRAEYTGAIGSAVADKVEVTAKAEVITTVAGVVTKVDDSYVHLTLENGSNVALRTVSMEEGEVEVGDILTIQYSNSEAEGGGMKVLSVEVTKAEK